jgi:hypothetical protein
MNNISILSSKPIANLHDSSQTLTATTLNSALAATVTSHFTNFYLSTPLDCPNSSKIDCDSFFLQVGLHPTRYKISRSKGQSGRYGSLYTTFVIVSFCAHTDLVHTDTCTFTIHTVTCYIAWICMCFLKMKEKVSESHGFFFFYKRYSLYLFVEKIDSYMVMHKWNFQCSGFFPWTFSIVNERNPQLVEWISDMLYYI